MKKTVKDLFILWNARNFPRTNFPTIFRNSTVHFSIDNMYCLKTLLRIGDRREVTGLALEMGLTNYKPNLTLSTGPILRIDLGSNDLFWVNFRGQRRENKINWGLYHFLGWIFSSNSKILTILILVWVLYRMATFYLITAFRTETLFRS